MIRIPTTIKVNVDPVIPSYTRHFIIEPSAFGGAYRLSDVTIDHYPNFKASWKPRSKSVPSMTVLCAVCKKPLRNQIGRIVACGDFMQYYKCKEDGGFFLLWEFRKK